MAHKLSSDEIEDAVARREGWSLTNGKLRRQLTFGDFNEAFGFMTRVALVAETHGHHPEWQNVYNRLTIDLTTHDVGGISDKDLAFADAVDAILGDG